MLTQYDAKHFAAEVHAVVAMIPYGHVATYGMIARLAGYPAYARQVGHILGTVSSETYIPCHRVVHADGSTVQSWHMQRRMLENEGIKFTVTGKVCLQHHLWNPETL